MDETAVDESMDLSEVRSEILSEKRPLEDGVESGIANKKARVSGSEVRLGGNVKKVAEIVLVLATMGKMRGGRKPTPVEVKMMAYAREKLAEVCKEFAPKEVFPRDDFGKIIEDFGLNRVKETKLGILPPKISIAEKLRLTKQKMEKADVFRPLHSATYTPVAAGSPATSHAVRTFPSSKADHASISSGSSQHRSTSVHSSPGSNSSTLPYQLPTSQVRPGVANDLPSSSHLGRDSTSSGSLRSGRPQLRSDERSNAKSAGDQRTSTTPTWSLQSQSASIAKSGLENGAVNMTNINHHLRHRMNVFQAPSINAHNEVGKIVQQILQPHMPKQLTWNPPSRDYMNKALPCQMCKSLISEVDTALVCDACERGYHLKCLQCNSKALFGDEWREWHCTKCLAISNGKPLPPKYGRVMRNISTPNMSSSMVGVLSSLENGNPGVPSESMKDNNKSTDTQLNGTPESGIEKSPEKSPRNSVERADENKLVTVSKSSSPANFEELPGMPNHLQATETHQDDDKKVMSRVTGTSSEQSLQKGVNLEGNTNGETGVGEKGVEVVNTAKISETCTPVAENECSSSISMHDVEWVGDVLNEDDEKTYYRSCCIRGIIYHLQDYALFYRSTGDNLMPNKLQGMWEDNKTSKKWVAVTRCFFPDDLPEGVGRPCAPETNEVYESNHETRLAAGMIDGPCKVVPPRIFCEERVMQNHSETRSEEPKAVFLCKWFYDEKKRVFRDVTC